MTFLGHADSCPAKSESVKNCPLICLLLLSKEILCGSMFLIVGMSWQIKSIEGGFDFINLWVGLPLLNLLCLSGSNLAIHYGTTYLIGKVCFKKLELRGLLSF
jgi:hypothetical protein